MSASAKVVEVVIAMGSNMGNRAHHMWSALRMMPNHGVQVYRQSCLYETYPAYVTDQPHFLNAAVLATTTLRPLQLLAELKRIEAAVGRDLEGGQRWGPRPIDLDVIFYGQNGHRCSVLEVPHPRWKERPFVKAPVADLLYERDVSNGHISAYLYNQDPTSIASSLQSIRHSIPSRISSDPCSSVLAGLMQAAGDWLRELPAAPCTPSQHFHANASEPLSPAVPPLAPSGGDASSAGPVMLTAAKSKEPSGGDIMRRVLPLGGTRRPEQFLVTRERTHVMGILNITPDSFSDGGQLNSVGEAVEAARRLAAQGAGLIDIGGQSTRPGAKRISPEEEEARVVPLIRALREDTSLNDVCLSVDTFYARVAKEAVMVGADVVNDVSGGSLDPMMLSQVAELGAPYILTHMRGDPSNMQFKENSTYSSVWWDVGSELQATAERAMAAGIPAWNIILDPGIGFSKTPQGNIELIRHLADLRNGTCHPPTHHTTTTTAEPPGSPEPHPHATSKHQGISPLQGTFRKAPILVGPSRKGFLGLITGQADPKRRDAATVAACVACVAAGADMVRVHNVADTMDGVRVADAVYRSGPLTLMTEHA